jgi:Fe-S oxidoreductase
MIRSVVFALVFLSAIGFFVFSCLRLIRTLKVGKQENRFDRVGLRIRNVLTVAFGQSKLLREPLAGMMHVFIFWGFVILLSAVLEAILEGFLPGFTLEALGPVFPPLAVLQEVVGSLVVIAVFLGLARWYLVPPKRYYGPEVGSHVRLDATLILLAILMIIVSMFGSNATRMLLTGSQPPSRFVSLQLAAVFRHSPQLLVWHETFWWVHILLVLGFLNYLPNSKHLHVLTSIPNVFFASLKPRGELSKLNLEDESADKFGANDITDLTWKNLLDGYTCTDCGRCTASCPANFTGKPLSPRKIIMNIRQRSAELSPLLQAGAAEQDRGISDHRLLDGYITEDELWACTTCQACMQECPVMIEHVPVIMDMRRFLVLTESRFPAELTTTFKNMENNFTPWAFSHETRADWAKGLDVKIMAEAGDEVDVLYWVGCAGSYDKRYEKVSRAMVQLMKAADVSFAILGTEEKCNGDVARRAGNEYLAQILMSENVQTLNKYNFKRIVATCPHCYNTLKNEYPQFGGNYQVVHHTDFLEELVRTGRLKVGNKSATRVTFHDSCYLGRYNGIYDTPRSLLRAAGSSLVEMRRSKDRGFCCGAGGARMFMEESVGKRVNVERTEEALSLEPEMIATACPFCMTMMADGLKARDAEEQTHVKDVAEVLASALVESSPKQQAT